MIAIEPWFLETTDEIFTDRDGWTLRSADGSRGAHAEHTIAITDDGPLVLTRPRLSDRPARAAVRVTRHRHSRQAGGRGARARVRSSCCSRRQASTAPWLPESSTGGTSRPRQTAGLV